MLDATLLNKKKKAQNNANSKSMKTNTAGQGSGKKMTNWEKMQNFRIDLGPSRKDIMNFTNQLSVMVKAGISLQDALESISQKQDNEKFKNILMDLKQKIEEGKSFSQALSCYPDVFSNIYINMVAAAEISGSLSEMLQKLSEYLAQEAETRSQIRGAMIYPGIIATMAIGATIFLLCYVLPKFTAIFAGKEHLLPTPTKILMGTSAFLRLYWYVHVPVAAAALGGFIYFIHTKMGRIWWDKSKLVIPIIKKLCKSLYITRSLHTMGVLTKAGVPILDTISITAQVSGNTIYKNMWLDVHDEVKQGKKIASTLSEQELMPSDVTQMIRSGEDSGTLSDVLRDVAEFYDKELRDVIKAVTSMIEPIMIVVMGFLVGFIAMSIMLPIFKMSSVVTESGAG